MSSKDKKVVIKFRAHHLLCILGFQGVGYSKKFIVNMENIIEVFRADGSSEVGLIHQCDDVCKYCPHNIGGRCQKKNSSAKNSPTIMDLKLLERLEIVSGAIIRISEAMSLIKERVDLNFMRNMCKDCEWKSLGSCEEGLKRLLSSEKVSF
ncbi:MAG TPA: DUF1284 domain-containing protein [Actinobacteria bacterium]|nr:DUF1284 domain-containing protein [Actinomycetota bacterium]